MFWDNYQPIPAILVSFQWISDLYDNFWRIWTMLKVEDEKIIFFFVDRIYHYVLRGISTFFTVFHLLLNSVRILCKKKKCFFTNLSSKNAKIASNAHRFANLWERNNPNDQKMQNYSNFLNLKKKFEFVYFPPFYDPQHQFWRF